MSNTVGVCYCWCLQGQAWHLGPWGGVGLEPGSAGARLVLWYPGLGLVPGLVLRFMGAGLVLKAARANLEHETVGMSVCLGSTGSGWAPNSGVPFESG